MHRFFCPDLSGLTRGSSTGGPTGAAPETGAGPARTIRLEPDETHHARRVLRLEPGGAIELFDGQGHIARGQLMAWSDGDDAASGARRKERHGGQAIVRVEEIRHIAAPRPAVDLAVAIPKGGHADGMIAGLSQLGVRRLIPLRARRAVVDPRPAKIDRFNRAAIESAKQCGRAYLMSVAAPMTLEQVLTLGHNLHLIAAPWGATHGASGGGPGLPARLRAAASALILIGPEGGWAPEELDAAGAAGCVPWSLGPHILRIETAAVAAAAIAGHMTWSENH